MEFDAIIFDMDGVLVDTTGWNTIAVNKMVKRYGFQLSTEDRRKTLGMTLADQIKIWKKHFGIKETIDPEKFKRQFERTSFRLMKDELKPDKHLLRLLLDLRRHNIKIAVATSAGSKRARKVLRLAGIYKFFKVIVTEEDVTRHKPDPDPFLKAAEKLGVAPGRCIVFEDSPNGTLAAKRGGMKSVALLTKYTKRESFSDTANAIISDFSQINIARLNRIAKK